MSQTFNQFGMPNQNYAQPARPTAAPQGAPQVSAAPPPSTNTSVTTTGHPNTMLRPDQAILNYLNQGMSPQQASDKVNAGDPFAKALYYPGQNVIGLPSSYISFDNGAWDITQRGPDGGGGDTSGTGNGPSAIGQALMQQSQNLGAQGSPFSQQILQNALSGLGSPQGSPQSLSPRPALPTPRRTSATGSPLLSALGAPRIS